MKTLFVHGLHSASSDFDSDELFEFRDVNTAFLEVGVTASFSGRVKLRCAGSVAVTTANL